MLFDPLRGSYLHGCKTSLAVIFELPFTKDTCIEVFISKSEMVSVPYEILNLTIKEKEGISMIERRLL